MAAVDLSIADWKRLLDTWAPSNNEQDQRIHAALLTTQPAPVNSIVIRLTPDKTGVEVLSAPVGTKAIHFAYMPTLRPNAGEVKYTGGGSAIPDPAYPLAKPFVPPAGNPVVDAIASSGGADIGSWAGRILTTPGVTPPPPPPPAGDMLVGLNSIGWGTGQGQLLSPVVKSVRGDTPSAAEVAALIKEGFKVIYLNPGDYNTGGVQTINAAAYAANAVAEVKARPGILAYEVLNEPMGEWYWGGNGPSQANATAYAKLLVAVQQAFLANFGSARPLILGSVQASEHTSSQEWSNRVFKTSGVNALAAVDGIAMHPYPWPGTVSEPRKSEVEACHADLGKPIYFTEIGWNTKEVSEAAQAHNLYNMIVWARSLGYVKGVMVFNWHDYSGGNLWGILTEDGKRQKPSYTALKEAAAGQPLTV